MAYLLIYGELPSSRELARWDEALMRHSAVPDAVERAVAALPHDAHFMGIVLTAINALSTVHPEQNPALAGQNIYQSKEIQDKQIVRLIGGLRRRFWGRRPPLQCDVVSIRVARLCPDTPERCNYISVIPTPHCTD